MLKERGKVFCATIVSGPMSGEKCIYTENEVHGKPFWNDFMPDLRRIEQTETVRIGKREIFVELFLKAPRLLILGGGHVSQPVCQIGKILGFEITVVDDRKEFVTAERFPCADHLLCCSFDRLPEELFEYENTFYVAVTRGHQGDRACARAVLSHPFAYFGMIGSRTKVQITKKALMEEGFSEEKVESMHSPIGLPLGGQLPEEIAMSIMAEIVQEKNRRYTGFADMDVADAVLKGQHGVMMTILSKSGSSPRGIGSKMFLGDSRQAAAGSIGGGNVEYTACRDAGQISDMQVKEYDLSVKDASNLGMVCGGHVRILFERI
ncbi:MAG: XdhC family protein [Anaerostipes sp.]|nr:XdhC family protein [Anaerostipes sp.]